MAWVNADTVRAILERNEARPIAAPPTHPLNYEDAAALAAEGGGQCEHQSDGSTLILVKP